MKTKTLECTMNPGSKPQFIRSQEAKIKRITVFRDEKKAICWKYEERFLIKVNKLWRIALTDTLKVLSLEEQEREFSSRS